MPQSNPQVSYSDLKTRFLALSGHDALSTEDNEALREFVNRRARIALERFPFPEVTIIGEIVTLGTFSQICTHNVSGTFAGGARTLFHNADVVFRVHKVDPKTATPADYAKEYKFISDVNATGDKVLNIIKPSGEDSGDVYVTYRRYIPEYISDGGSDPTYGDKASDNQNVPYFLLNYLVHGSFVDYLKSDGQLSKAQAEEMVAEQLLQQAIDMVRTQGRQYRNDVIQYRPTSQFNRHNRGVGGKPVVEGEGME